MFVIERLTGNVHPVVVEPVVKQDYKRIAKSVYFFDWKTEKKNLTYKLKRKDSDAILGLISLMHHQVDQRLEIKLLSVSKENRGRNKRYKRIAGTLIGFACREALKYHGIQGCVSLEPKTKLKRHYMSQYGMLDGGRQVFLEGVSLLKMLNTYVP